MKEEELDRIRIDEFNQGRENADKKWIDGINERIKELEIKVGIPELKRIRDKIRFRWSDDEIENPPKVAFTRRIPRKRKTKSLGG